MSGSIVSPTAGDVVVVGYRLYCI